MSNIQVFDFDPARLEGTFSDMQPVSDSVQRAESVTPGCCGRTHITIACREFERHYRLQLPLKSKKPNETPGEPPSNHLAQVMTAQVPPPVLQILSGYNAHTVAEITTTAIGPSQCPPGTTSKLRLEGLGGGVREIPQTGWTWPAPAILDVSHLEELDEEFISLFHPFKMPDLPAQTWSIDLPRCPLSGISARIAAFPDLRWSGRLDITTKPKPDGAKGHDLILGGDLACSYDGKTWRVKEKNQARTLCPWVDALEMLARSVTAIMALRPSIRHSVLDSRRLARLDPLRFEPWPRLSIKLEAGLFEQEGNGLLGHSLRLQLQAAPMMGASGEMSLLGAWMEQANKKPLIGPLLAGLDVVRAEEAAQEVGLWLTADGSISLGAGVEARRPHARTVGLGRASGEIPVAVEARSIHDFDSFVIHQGGGPDADVRPGFRAACAPPAESPLDDPREHKPKAAVEFTGLTLSRLEKSRPGCTFRHWVKPAPFSSETEEKSVASCQLIPSRSWPGEATVHAPIEIPWCP